MNANRSVSLVSLSFDLFFSCIVPGANILLLYVYIAIAIVLANIFCEQSIQRAEFCIMHIFIYLYYVVCSGIMADASMSAWNFIYYCCHTRIMLLFVRTAVSHRPHSIWTGNEEPSYFSMSLQSLSYTLYENP